MKQNAWGKPLTKKPIPLEEDPLVKELMETDVDTVHLDALVVLKIIKYCRDDMPELVTGQLLGLDVGPTLEVTNCFPFPRSTEAEDEEDEGADYQIEMMRCLREVRADAYTVGWYQSTYLGSFMNEVMIETQYNYQTNPLITKKCVVLIYDPMRTAKSGLSLKAFRLTSEFIGLYKPPTDTTKPFITQESLGALGLTYKDVFEEVPIKIKNSHLVKALVKQLQKPGYVRDDFKVLDLSSNPFLEKNLILMNEYLDELMAEQNKLQNYFKALQRQKKAKDAKARKDHDGGTSSSYTVKVGPPPNRLDSLLVSNQISNYCEQIVEYASQSVSKLFLSSTVLNPKVE